jgi:DNA-binding beta-propeller fold protein YncE
MPFKALNSREKKGKDSFLLNSHKTKRSQSALEYMMTYGWAILIIVIVAVILYSMGIFNPSSSVSSTVTGFSGFVVPAAICSPTGYLLITLGNSVGYYVEITNLTAISGSGASQTIEPNITLSPSSTYTFAVPFVCPTSTSTHYSLKVELQYTEPSQYLKGPYFSSGSVSGSTASSISFDIWGGSGSANGTAYAISPLTGNVVFKQKIYGYTQGSTAIYITVSPNGYVYVSNNAAPSPGSSFSAFVSVFSPSGNLVATIPWNISRQIAITPNGEYAYIGSGNGAASSESNRTAVVALSSNKIVKMINIHNDPWVVVMSPHGNYVYTLNGIYEPSSYGRWVSVISTKTNTVIKNISLPYPFSPYPADIAVSPNGDFVYITEPENIANVTNVVSKSAGWSIVHNITFPTTILGIATSPTTGYIYVVSGGYKSSLLYVVNPSTYQIVDTIQGVVSYARHVVITPNGQYAYVGGTGISVVSLSKNQVITNVTVPDNYAWDVGVAPS